MDGRNVLMIMTMNKVLERTGAPCEVAERDLENALTNRIPETLREPGLDFAFVGRQVHFDVDSDDFYVDLLSFPRTMTPNFYVALVDDVLRRDFHNETVGILICGTQNDRTVRYSLGRSTSPLAVAAYYK